MGIVKGLKNINAHIEEQEAKFANRDSDSPKARWLSLKDKEAVKAIFLQELDADAKNYSTKNGLGFIAVEHSNPKNFKRKALCSIDEEGLCLGCEKHRKDPKEGWKQKSRLYINALIDDGVNDPYVAIVSQGNGPKSITPSLVEQATEIETITDKVFKIKRSGSGLSDTSYLLTPLGEHDKDVEAYELYDLDSVVREIPYAKQEEHYLSTGNGSPEASPQEPAKGEDETW